MGTLTGASHYEIILVDGVGVGYTSFDLDNDIPNPAQGGRSFPGPVLNPFGIGWRWLLKLFSNPPVPVPDCQSNPNDPACGPEEFIHPRTWPGPLVDAGAISMGGGAAGNKTPRPVFVANQWLTAYDYTPIDGTSRVSFDWVDISNTAVPRIFIKKSYGVIYEFEGYGSQQIDQMKWRMIRAYRGDWSTPDWEKLYSYDATQGHGGLTGIVDRRGLRTTMTWNQVTVGQSVEWRVTQISQQAPAGAGTSWAQYAWSQLDVTLEYDDGYLVAIKRQPRVIRHDVTGNKGDGNLDPTGTFEPITRFVYDSASSMLNKPLNKVYEDLDGGGVSPGYTDCRLLVSYTYYDAVLPNLPWRVKEKRTGPDRLGNYALDTFSYDDVYKRCTWVDAVGVQRIYTYAEQGSVFTHGNQNYSVRHLAGNRALTRYEVKDLNSPRQGYFQYGSRITTYDYVNCSCGAPSTIVYPTGLKHVWEFDSDMRGLPTKLTITPPGGGQSRVWAWSYYDRSEHHKKRDQLKSTTDPSTYMIYHDYNVTNGVLKITDRAGSSSGPILREGQYNDYGDPLWIEGESFSVDGGGSSKGRIEFIYGTDATLVDYRLLKTLKRVHGATPLTESFTYEGPGYLTSTTDAKGRTTTLQNNYMGWPTQITLPTTKSGYVSGTGGMLTHGGQIDLEYDLRGQLSVLEQYAYKKDGGAYPKAQVE